MHEMLLVIEPSAGPGVNGSEYSWRRYTRAGGFAENVSKKAKISPDRQKASPRRAGAMVRLTGPTNGLRRA
jgi:hypothetical protein